MLLGLVFVGTVTTAFNQEQTTPIDLAKLHSTLQWSMKYLKTYHPDFGSLQFELSHSSQQLYIRDASSKLLKEINLDHCSDAIDVFSSVASVLLDQKPSSVSGPAREALKSAWYWDAKARDNPAVFDQLALPQMQTNLSHDGVISFWRYRLLMLQHGGRKHLWAHIRQHPSVVEQLNPSLPLSLDQAMDLLELQEYKLAPVMKLKTSNRWLTRMQQFALKDVRSDAIEWVLLGELPDRIRNDASLLKQLERRIYWIKLNLPRVNPLSLNAFQSLGVCYERIIAQDASGFQAAHLRFNEDLEFVSLIAQRIEERKIHMEHKQEAVR